MGVSPPHAPVFFPFFGTAGAIFFISLIIILSIHTRWLLCLPVLRLRLRWDKCVASRLRYRYELSFSFRPTPSPRLFSLCLLDLVPRPLGVGCAGVYLICCCGHGDGLPASPSCRSALSLPLVRYCGSVRPAGRIAWLSRRFRAVIVRRSSPSCSIWLKRFNRCGSLSNHPSIACGDVMPFNPVDAILFLCLPVPSSSSSVCPSLAGGWCDAWFCVPLALSVGGPPRSPLPRPAILPAGRGWRRDACGELDETARVPMIG